MDAIEKGGLTIGGKTPQAKKQNLYTILARSSEFTLFKRDTWALTSWPGMKEKKSKEGQDNSEPKKSEEKEA